MRFDAATNLQQHSVAVSLQPVSPPSSLPTSAALSRALRASPHSTSFHPTHQTLIQSLRDVKFTLSNFVAGSKALYRAIVESRNIKRNNEPSSLTRAQRLHLVRTRSDALGGLIIVILFWVPIVGNIVPLLVSYFPRQLPTVFVTNEMLYHVMLDDARHTNLYHFYAALLQSSEALGDSSLQKSSLLSDPHDFMYPRLSLLLFQLLSSSDLSATDRCNHLFLQSTRHEVMSLLRLLGLASVLYVFLPQSHLVNTLKSWAARIRADDMLLITDEKRGATLNLRELMEACQARGLYQTLVSSEFECMINLERKQRLGMPFSNLENSHTVASLQQQVHHSMLNELREWLSVAQPEER